MPAKKTPEPPHPAENASRFPTLEAFVEWALEEDVERLFAPLKSELDALKGPRVEQVKRVRTAIARTEELLKSLLETRRELEESR